jgi:cytoskeletal protein CcmA (bactofilin family)
MAENEKSKTIITEDVEITGSIKCASHIHIDGKLNGDLTCSGNAVIGTSSTIKGNLTVNSISILGQVNGNITAADRIELKSTARLNGDIRAKRLTVEDGVTFIGKSEVNPAGTTARPAGGTDAKHDSAGDKGEKPHQPRETDDANAKSGFFNKK